jgi:hypothetical protein
MKVGGGSYLSSHDPRLVLGNGMQEIQRLTSKQRQQQQTEKYRRGAGAASGPDRARTESPNCNACPGAAHVRTAV